jgi:hypothetical protein
VLTAALAPVDGPLSDSRTTAAAMPAPHSSASSTASCDSDAPAPPCVFAWYAVRPPSSRATPILPSAIEKRHTIVAAVCLTYSRTRDRDPLPAPFTPLVLDD